MAAAPRGATKTTSRRSQRHLTTTNLRQTIVDVIASVRPRSSMSLRFVVFYALLTAVVLFLTQLLLVIVGRRSIIGRSDFCFDDGSPMMTALEYYATQYYFRRRPTKVESFRHVVVRRPTDGVCDDGGGGSSSSRRNSLDRWITGRNRSPTTEWDVRDGLTAVILVASHPNETARRDVIRRTWGGVLRRRRAVVRQRPVDWPGISRSASRRLVDQLELAFVVGLRNAAAGRSGSVADDEELQREATEYDDIIQGSFTDTYWNLTLKTLLMLHIAVVDCPRARFLVKADTDVFVNLPYLVRSLKAASSASFPSSIILGTIVNNATTPRGDDKFGLTYDQYPLRMLPYYAAGPLYAVSNSDGLTRRLLETSNYIPHLAIEDVYVTGVLGRAVDAVRVQLNGSFGFFDRPARGEDVLADRVLVQTNQSPDDMFRTWSEMVQLSAGGHSRDSRL